MLGALQRLVHHGDVVYDIGANIGLYSRFLVQCFGASHVYAFEPSEDNRRLLSENLSHGRCASQVDVVPYAVGNEDGMAEFQVDDLSSNSGSLDVVTGGKPSASRAQYGLPPRTVRVSVARLDSLVESMGFAKPNVIKLDVEGAEAIALMGGEALLRREPCRLIIELHGSDVSKQVLNILWRYSYHCFGFLTTESGTTYTRLSAEHLKYMTHKYSLRYVAASSNPSELSTPIEEFHL